MSLDSINLDRRHFLPPVGHLDLERGIEIVARRSTPSELRLDGVSLGVSDQLVTSPGQQLLSQQGTDMLYASHPAEENPQSRPVNHPAGDLLANHGGYTDPLMLPTSPPEKLPLPPLHLSLGEPAPKMRLLSDLRRTSSSPTCLSGLPKEYLVMQPLSSSSHSPLYPRDHGPTSHRDHGPGKDRLKAVHRSREGTPTSSNIQEHKHS